MHWTQMILPKWRESRDLVRSALINSHCEFSERRITINLAPADPPKDGGRFDLTIAMGILAASGQIDSGALSDYEFIGELALSGELRPVDASRIRRDPAWILPRIKRNRTDDLPIFVNQEVFRAIVVNFIDSEWLKPSEVLILSTKKLLVQATEKTLNDTAKSNRK